MKATAAELKVLASAEVEGLTVSMLERLLHPLRWIFLMTGKRESAMAVQHSLEFLSLFRDPRDPGVWLQNQETIQREIEFEFTSLQKLLHGGRLISKAMEHSMWGEALTHRVSVTECFLQAEMAFVKFAAIRGVRI